MISEKNRTDDLPSSERKPPVERRKCMWIFSSLFLIALTGYLVWPEPPLDLSNDEEPFRSIAMPPKSVTSGYYMDGGSVILQVIDRKGAKHIIHFIVDYEGILNNHATADSGREGDYSKPLKNVKRARFIAIKLIGDYAEKNRNAYGEEGSNEGAQRYLSKSPEMVGERFMRKLNSWTR